MVRQKIPYTPPYVNVAEKLGRVKIEVGSGQLHHSSDRVDAVVSEEPVLVAAGVLEVEERGTVYDLLGVWNAVPYLADVDGRHACHRQDALRIVVKVAQLVNQVPVGHVTSSTS